MPIQISRKLSWMSVDLTIFSSIQLFIHVQILLFSTLFQFLRVWLLFQAPKSKALVWDCSLNNIIRCEVKTCTSFFKTLLHTFQPWFLNFLSFFLPSFSNHYFYVYFVKYELNYHQSSFKNDQFLNALGILCQN